MRFDVFDALCTAENVACDELRMPMGTVIDDG
jgi:hypothetical protein